MPYESWSAVEEYEVEPLARHLTSETRRKRSNRLPWFLAREWLIHEDGHIEVAVLARLPERAAAKQKSRAARRESRPEPC